MLKDLKEIELNSPVELIEFKGQKVWPYLRIYFASKLIHNSGSKQVDSSIVKSFFKSFFYGFSNIFRSYKYLYFTSSDQRRKTRDKFTDKSVDSIASLLGDGLVFEFPSPNHYKKDEIPTKNIISKYILYFLVLVHSKLFLRKAKITNSKIIDVLLKEYNLELNYRDIICKHYSQYRIMTLMLKLYKPKAVFFVCYYTNMGYIKALKENNIKVIEIQHGLINDTHDAYVIFKKIDTSFYPDFLLTFGEKEKEVFTEENFFIDTKNIIPIGHFYLDFLSKQTVQDKELSKISEQYKKIVSITSQNHYIEEQLIDFVIKSAKLDDTILYVFIPRTLGKSAEEYGFPSNVILVDWLNCYEIIAHSDFHSTVFSSCAIEAPSIGVQNIMINLDNLSKTVYGNILTNSEITCYAETPNQYVDIINSFIKLKKNEIIYSNETIISPDYLNKLDSHLKKILEL